MRTALAGQGRKPVPLANPVELEHPVGMDWTVYIIRCSDDTLYTGVTNDLERRFREHARGPRGARYFAGREPVEVVYREGGHTRASASRREAEIKRLGRADKLRLVAGD